MKVPNPDAKTLEETSGSSGFFSCSQESDDMASGFEVQARDSNGGVGLDCVGSHEVIGNNAGDFGRVVEIEGSKEEKEGLSRGGDTVRKIEVSGENISLFVDFSGSLTGLSCQNAFECSGSSLTVNVEKGNAEGDQHLGFLVGDIVWVLTKYRHWWPGEVVDFKADQKDSLMVRYFGQSHVFLWRSPSRLRPFNQDIENMLRQGKGKSFIKAVEKAMALLGDSLKLELTCPCISRENVQSAENGILRKTKPSLFREFSVDRMEPERVVAQLKNLAKCSSISGILELTVMRSRLLAFYSFLGHKQIPMDQLCENAGKQSPVPAKRKPRKKVEEGSIYRKRAGDNNEEPFSISEMETKVPGSRDRKRSKYLSYPFLDSNERESNKVLESTNQFAGSPSTAIGSTRKRFQKEWFRKFISEEGNASIRTELVNASLSDLISELRFLATDYLYSKETDNFRLTEWFFSKFRMSVFHDEHIYEMQFTNTASEKDLILAKVANPGAWQKTPEIKHSPKSEIGPISGPSAVHSDPGTHGLCAKDSQETILAQTPSEQAPEADAPSRPPTLVLDLNSGSTILNSTEPDRPQRLNTPGFLEGSGLGGETKSMMLNFQVTGSSCSIDDISGTGFIFGQPGSEMNLSRTDISTYDTNPGQKKRKWKRKRKEEPPLVTQTAIGIPDLNGMTTDANSPLPQEKPTQRKRRRKKEELPNGETKRTTFLLLKFVSGVSMPSKDDLTSTFSGFGPLDATETHVSKDSGGAQVAFVSSGDAIEAVKSLEKTNPFGETLASFRLQQKPATVYRNIAPRMPVISGSPAPRPSEPPLSVDMIRQNLMMMTSMLETSGDSLSEEMRVKLKSEITGLLQKVSSMPSSSSS